ncbi:MAG: MFS transporter [Elusimicrobia bacterium]|nr:MFS transporter [Elusimicrobiota bacterium]
MSRPLWTLFAAQALLVSGISLSFPFFALYFHRVRGVPMAWTGAALAVNVLVGALAHVVGGEVSDILGRQRVMRWSLILRAVTVAALAWAVWKEAPIPILLLLLFASGFVGHLFDPAARGWIADRCPAHERGRAYSLLRIAVNAGWAVGPAVGGALAQTSYALMFLATAAASGACAALVAAGIEDAPGLRPRDVFAWRGMLAAGRDARFLRVSGLSLLVGVVMSQFIVSLSVHSTEFVGLTEGQVGWLFSLNGVLVVLLQYPATSWTGRRPITTAIAAGSLIYAVGYTLVGAAGGLAAMLGAMMVITLGEIVVAPGMQSLWANLAPAPMRGRYVGFGGLAYQIGSAMGPLLGGLGLQHLSPRYPAAPWLGVAGVAVATGAGFLMLSHALTPEEQGLVPE